MGLYVSTHLRILVLAADPTRAHLLQHGLAESGKDTVVVAAPDTGLLAAVRQHKSDALIVALEAPTRTLIEQLRALGREAPRPVVVFVDRSDDVGTKEAIAAGASAYVVDGLSAKRVPAILDAAIARFQAFEGLRRELDETRSSLAERKIVDRAKGILMHQRVMSEDDAYKALRKMAMDQGRKLADVAQSVVAVADLLKR